MNRKIVGYLIKHRTDLAFAEFFWKGCELNQDELARYSRFVQTLLMHNRGLPARIISERMRVSLASVRYWIRSKRNSKLTDYLREFMRLGEPRHGWVWLSVNNTPGHAIPLGPFIEVPKVVACWRDVQYVLDQLRPLRRFDALRGRPSRAYLFGFLLGIMIGDAAKSRTGTWHRHLNLTLSKKYETNRRIGEFAATCARSFGLRMHRISDTRGGEKKPHDFYNWVSQASALLDWIFNVCLGLDDGQRTTYDPVRMDWAMRSPKEFRRGLVQGMAESDGSVSIASQTVEFWIGPNWEFGRRLLLTFGVRSFRNREAISVTKNQVGRLYRIPAFSPMLRTVRYRRFERLARATHIKHGRRIPLEIRESVGRYGRRGMSVPRISERILDEFGVVLSFEAVQRWAKR